MSAPPDAFAQAWLELYGYLLPDPPERRGWDPSLDIDENTTRLSRRAARAQRAGRYFPTCDADGIDRDGWAHGATYGKDA